MKTKNIIPYLLILVLSGFIWFTHLQNQKLNKQVSEELEYWQKKDFKTDTIKVQDIYHEPKNVFPNYVGPKNYYTYLSDTSSNVLKYMDSLIQVNDSLGKTLATINSQYIKKFPNKPKLIYGYFSRDTLKLDLLKTDGQTYRYEYLTNYQSFRYQFSDSLFAERVYHKYPTPKRTYFQGAYASGGYDFLLKQPIGTIDVSYGIKKVRLSAELKSTINSQPQFFGNVKLGYRLK